MNATAICNHVLAAVAHLYSTLAYAITAPLCPHHCTLKKSLIFASCAHICTVYTGNAFAQDKFSISGEMTDLDECAPFAYPAHNIMGVYTGWHLQSSFSHLPQSWPACEGPQ